MRKKIEEFEQEAIEKNYIIEDIDAPTIYMNYLRKLQEVYKKTDVSFIDDFLDDLYTNTEKEEDVFKIAKKYDVNVEIVESSYEDLFIRGGYGYDINKITFFISRKGLQNFLSDDMSFYNKALFDFKRSLTHEDTHKQQNKLSNSKAFKKYINLPKIYSKNVNDNVSYFDQYVEADAYGRQVGYQLRHQFGNEMSANEIYSKIKDGYVRSDILNVYSDKDNGMSEKNRRKFWHTLWQYLDNQEENN